VVKDAVTRNTTGTHAHSTLIADKEFKEEIMMPIFLHVLQTIVRAIHFPFTSARCHPIKFF
jgi:hypothetical protein